MEIRVITLLLCAAGCVVCIILFPGAWKQGVNRYYGLQHDPEHGWAH